MKLEYILCIQNIALAEVLSETPSLDFFYRRTCRQYSQKFSTPLPQVYSIPFDEVLREVSEVSYEATLMEDEGEDDLLFTAMKVVNPELEEDEEEDNEEFLRKTVEEENLRRARSLAKTLAPAPDQPQPLPVEPPPQAPAGRSTTFDDDVPPEAFESNGGNLDDL